MVLGNTFFLEINGFTYDIKRAPLNFLKNIGKKEGLPNNDVYAMVEPNNNLWISFDK